MNTRTNNKDKIAAIHDAGVVVVACNNIIDFFENILII